MGYLNMNKIELKHSGIGSKLDFDLKINNVNVDIINYKIESSGRGKRPMEITFKMYADPKNSIIDIRPADDSV